MTLREQIKQLRDEFENDRGLGTYVAQRLNTLLEAPVDPEEEKIEFAIEQLKVAKDFQTYSFQGATIKQRIENQIKALSKKLNPKP